MAADDSLTVTPFGTCPVPRSLTLVTTAGLISTHTIFTQLGSMFPVAIECSMLPKHNTSPAPRKCSAYASCAAVTAAPLSSLGSLL